MSRAYLFFQIYIDFLPYRQLRIYTAYMRKCITEIRTRHAVLIAGGLSEKKLLARNAPTYVADMHPEEPRASRKNTERQTVFWSLSEPAGQPLAPT